MKFWTKLLLYLSPFVILFALLSAVMVYTGEAMPLQWVVEQQMTRDDVLFRPRYGNRDQQFKLLSVNLRRPQIVALGSSRILQFRAGFFDRNPDAFYNAAAPAWQLPQILRLVENIAPDATPRVIILAIDPPWFNDAYVGDTFPPDRSDGEHLLDVDKALLHDLITGGSLDRPGFSLVDYLNRREPQSGALALGLRAIRDGQGFRSDGSEQYGDFLVAGWLSQADTRDAHRVWMREGQEMYVYGDTVSGSSMEVMNQVLATARQRGITVIGYLPSYMPSLWADMVASGNYTYIQKLVPQLQALFDSYGYPLFDFSDGARVATSDDEFFDGWHASELSNLRLYIEMAQAQPEILGAYSDVDALRAIAASATDTWNVFGLAGTL